MKLVMYGAGSIGRGFIGPLFAAAGWEVVFIDVNRQLVTELNRRGEYPLIIASDPPAELPIRGVRAVNGLDSDAAAAEIASCDLLATSLGAAVLPRVAPVIAAGLVQRKPSGNPLDILICENLKDAAHLLRGWLSDALPDCEQALLSSCGLVETAIGRMVPVAVPTEAGDPLAVTVEEYDFLPVDKAAFLGPIPEIPQLVPFSPFSYYEERKLYLHNMGHAACAYLGLLGGHALVADAVADAKIRLIVQSAMEESALMLSARYGVAYPELHAHLLDLLHRFGNRRLGDTCERVARDPLRKLGADDRFAGALKSCRSQGVTPVCTGVGFAAALLSQTANNAEAKALLQDVSRLPPDDTALVLELYAALQNGGPAAAFSAAEQCRHTCSGRII